MKGLFLTGAIRSGTSWVFALLAERISPAYLERFDCFELEERRRFLEGHDDFLFKINEDMRGLGSLRAAFPKSKVAVVLRHPLEALRSIARPHPDSKPFRPFHDLRKKWVRPGDEGMFRAAVRRLESYFPEETLKLFEEEREWLRVVRYEDLLSDFVPTLSGLLSFGGVELARENLPLGDVPKKTPNQGVRLKDFSGEERDCIADSSLLALCERLGYSEAS